VGRTGRTGTPAQGTGAPPEGCRTISGVAWFRVGGGSLPALSPADRRLRRSAGSPGRAARQAGPAVSRPACRFGGALPAWPLSGATAIAATGLIPRHITLRLSERQRRRPRAHNDEGKQPPAGVLQRDIAWERHGPGSCYAPGARYPTCPTLCRHPAFPQPSGGLSFRTSQAHTSGTHRQRNRGHGHVIGSLPEGVAIVRTEGVPEPVELPTDRLSYDAAAFRRSSGLPISLAQVAGV
jgi:hypothetical protein